MGLDITSEDNKDLPGKNGKTISIVINEDWFMTTQKMTKEEIIEEFGDVLSYKEKEALENILNKTKL
jgi:hypothetical protein